MASHSTVATYVLHADEMLTLGSMQHEAVPQAMDITQKVAQHIACAAPHVQHPRNKIVAHPLLH